MIVLHGLKIAIMTPPKCATNSLHAALRQPPLSGETFVGPSPGGGWNRHYNVWPSEVLRYRKLVVTRAPKARLVSMYLHLCSRCAGRGLPSLSFRDYVSEMLKPEPYFGPEFSIPLYSWNLSRWFRDVVFDATVRVESLVDDLNREGVVVRGELPRLNVSYRGQDVAEFYTAEILSLVEPWLAEDRDRFRY